MQTTPHHFHPIVRSSREPAGNIGARSDRASAGSVARSGWFERWPCVLLIAVVAISCPVPAAETVALWLFDEPAGLYPSTPLDSAAGLDAPLVLGLGGTVVPGRFGQALSTEAYPPIELPAVGQATAALQRASVPAGRTQEPLTWHNAGFTALMTSGEPHIRKEVSFVSPTKSDLNLGDFDWTVEFWLKIDRDGAGVVFEVGSGPRGENDQVTRLSCDPAAGSFLLENHSSRTRVEIPTSRDALRRGAGWHHYAIAHREATRELFHFVDGRRQPGSRPMELKRLPVGDEDYMSFGRDGRWGRVLPGVLDEVRISRGVAYTADFEPRSHAILEAPVALHAGPPLLFAGQMKEGGIVPLGDRKHLFLDAAFIARNEHISFSAHPPRRIDRVIDGTEGQFRKHLTVIEDDDGLIRLYNAGPDDYLMVHTSRDGLRFEAPDTGIHHKGRRNIVIAEPAPLGRPIIDFNGPPEQRWKYLSGYEGRGVYLYTSPDGWKWTRQRTAAASFRSGSQSSFYYDDQRQRYVAFHRTGFPLSAGGATRREFVVAETTDLSRPWPIPSLTQREVWAIAKVKPLRSPQPWWLDNGPLTPGDFGMELPVVFAPDDRIDPPGSGVYVPKATKYPWAPDAYVAFPNMYFDYEEPGQPETRRTLMDESRGLGSGLVEVQVAVSRDGLKWTRYPTPGYVPVGPYLGRNLHQIYMSEGLIRRGEEIWQYFYGQEEYHSPVRKNPAGNGVYRAVQRLDGFISADAPYDRLGTLVTRPFTFTGSRLVLNIDTGGLGYAQVGLLDAEGHPIPGFGIDECVYINGNFVAHEVEWLGKGTDVSALAGRPVRLEIRMRGASLYALQFTGAGTKLAASP